MPTKGQRPTMTDIASALGLHRRTVSAVVNGRARERRISPRTEKRVRDYLQSIGYVPSRQARDLRAGGAARQGLGILLRSANYRYLAPHLQLFFEALHSSPAPVETLVSSDEGSIEALQELAARGCSSLLWLQAGSDEREVLRPEALLPLLQNFTHKVVHNYRFGFGTHEDELVAAGAHLVGVDRLGGMARLGELLVEHGHRRVAFVFEGNAPVLGAELRDLGLEVHTVTGTTAEATSLRLYRPELCERVMDCYRTHGVTAMVFNNDQSAMAAMLAAEGAGLHVPGDLTLVAWAGSVYAEGLRVPLTTVDIPIPAMVERSLELLATDADAGRHLFPATLRPRASHGPVNPSAGS